MKKKTGTRTISVWLSHEEADWIKAQAKSAGLSLDDWFDKFLLRAIKRLAAERKATA